MKSKGPSFSLLHFLLLSLTIATDPALSKSSHGYLAESSKPSGGVVVQCIKNKLSHLTANPSNLNFYVAGSNDLVGTNPLSGTIGHVPPLNISQIAEAVLTDIGFTVAGDALNVQGINKAPTGSWFLKTAITGFTPLSTSTIDKRDYDVILMDDVSEKHAYYGEVTAISMLYYIDNASVPVYKAIGSYKQRVPFSLIKEINGKNFGFAGLSYGKGTERIRINSVSDASEVAVGFSVIAVISKVLEFQCI